METGKLNNIFYVTQTAPNAISRDSWDVLHSLHSES